MIWLRLPKAFSTIRRQRVSLDKLRNSGTQYSAPPSQSQVERPFEQLTVQPRKLVKIKDLQRAYFKPGLNATDRSAIFCRWIQLVKLNNSPEELLTNQFRIVSTWIHENLEELTPQSLVYVLDAVSRLPKETKQQLSGIQTEIARMFREQGSMELISHQLALRLMGVCAKLCRQSKHPHQLRKIVQLCISRVLPHLNQTKTISLLRMLSITLDLDITDKGKIKPICEQLLTRKKYLKATDAINMFAALNKCKDIAGSFKESWKDTDTVLRCLKVLQHTLNDSQPVVPISKLIEIANTVRCDKSGRYAEGRLEYFNDMLYEKCLNSIASALESATLDNRAAISDFYELLDYLHTYGCSSYIEALTTKVVGSCLRQLPTLDFDTQTTLMWLLLNKSFYSKSDINWSKLLSADKKYRIDKHTVRKVLGMLDFNKTVEVEEQNAAFRTYLKLSLQFLMKNSRNFSLKELESVALSIGGFCKKCPTVTARLLKEIIRGLKTNAELNERLIDYLEHSYKNLQHARNDRAVVPFEVKELHMQLLNAIHSAYLAILLLESDSIPKELTQPVLPEVSKYLAFSLSQFGFDGLMPQEEASAIAAMQIYFERQLIQDSKLVQQAHQLPNNEFSKVLAPKLSAQQLERRRTKLATRQPKPERSRDQ